MKQADTSDREIVTTRVLRAPRELVYRAWTDPVHVAKWWGPRGFTNTVHEMNVTPGGVWRVTMHGPDGTDYPNRIIYSEVVKNERLAYSHDSDKENDPHGFDVVVTFADQGRDTLVTLRAILQSPEARQFVIDNHNAIEGGKQTLERFAEHVATLV